MATATETKQKYEQEAGSLKTWLDARRTDAGLNFTGDDGVAFDQRNEALKGLFDDWQAAKAREESAAQLDAQMAEAERAGASTVTRGGNVAVFNGDGQTQTLGAVKSLGQAFLDSPEYKTHKDKSPDIVQQWSAEIKGVDMGTSGPSYAAMQDGMKAALTTTTGVVPYPAARPGIVDYATQRPTMRNLLTVDDPNGQLVQFIRQNVQTFGAAVVAEGAAKPETSLGTERVVITMEAIAHYIKVTNQALSFIPGVRDLIDRKGTLGLQLAEEDAILNYNGSAGWKGFLVQTGVQTDTVGGSDKFSAFHRGMTLIQSVGFADVTGFVIHPNDWHEIVTIKDLQNRFIYGDPAAATPSPRLWGVPGISTTKMTEGTVLQGDFVMDAKLWVAGGIRVIVGYVNDDLTKNQQTIVVEEYAALEIDRPASFLRQTGY